MKRIPEKSEWFCEDTSVIDIEYHFKLALLEEELQDPDIPAPDLPCTFPNRITYFFFSKESICTLGGELIYSPQAE